MKYSFLDKTNDKKYFTIIPNLVINGSSAYEQALYLTMKRIAGEHGTCFASQNTLAKKLHVSQWTISKTLIKLLERGWIKKLGLKKGKTRPVTEYEITDIWVENVNQYEKDILSSNKSSLDEIHRLAIKDSSSSYIKNNIDIKKNIKNNIHEHKVRVYKRLPLEKQQLIHRLCYHLEDLTGTKIVNWGKQGKAMIAMIKAGFTEDEIKKTITYMAKSDEFFADKGFDLVTVSNQIGRYKAMAMKRNNHV
jgi:DNA-binding MarR family transcriptional regulator